MAGYEEQVVQLEGKFFLDLLLLFCLEVNFTGHRATLPPRNAHQLLG